MTLKMLKMMQIYQKYIFWVSHSFFLLFLISLKIYKKNMGQKLGSNIKHGVSKGHWVDQKRTNFDVMKMCLFKRNYDRLMYV